MTTTSKLSEEDLSQGLLFLDQTRDALLGAVRLLNDAQWRFQPAPDRWSIAQTVEHIAFVQDRVIASIAERLPSAPPPPPEQDRAVVDGLVMSRFQVRLRKFPSPVPAAEPQLSRTDAISRYRANCETLKGLLASTPGLRDHVLEAAPLKAVSGGAYSVMDGYQWILASASHSERHTKQILETIADDAFPL